MEKIKERIAGISQADDDIQIWDGEEYAFVVVAVDQTLLQWETDRETLDTEHLLNDPTFGWLCCSAGQPETQVRRSVGFQ